MVNDARLTEEEYGKITEADQKKYDPLIDLSIAEWEAVEGLIDVQLRKALWWVATFPRKGLGPLIPDVLVSMLKAEGLGPWPERR